MGTLALLGLALLLLGGSKKAPSGTVTPGLPTQQKTTVRIGPAKLKPPVKVKLGTAKIKPVQVVVPTSMHDTAAAVVQAAAKPGAPPIPNPAAARAMAQSVADHVRNNRKKYDHGKVGAFQALAGIKSDGLYGPVTAKTLRAFGAKNVVG